VASRKNRTHEGTRVSLARARKFLAPAVGLGEGWVGKFVYSEAQIFSLVRHLGLGCGIHI